MAKAPSMFGQLAMVEGSGTLVLSMAMPPASTRLPWGLHPVMVPRPLMMKTVLGRWL